MFEKTGDPEMNSDRNTRLWNGLMATRIENCTFDDPMWEQDLRNVLRFCHQIRSRFSQPMDGLAIALSAGNIMEGFYAHLARATDAEYADVLADLRSAEGADAGEDSPARRSTGGVGGDQE